jgi:hypothetical protein
MLSLEKKQKVTEGLKAWIDTKNPRKTATYLRGVTGVNDTFISFIKKGTHEQNGYPLADAHYYKLAKEIGLELDEKLHWETDNFSTIQMALKVAQKNQRRMILDGPTRQGKTYALEYYTSKNEKVLYIKCRKSMKTKDLLFKMASRLNMNMEGIKGEMAMMDAVMEKLTGENGWLIILDECERKQNSLYDAIKEIEDFTRGIAGLAIVGAGMIRDWNRLADRQKGIFPQLRGRFFVNRLELGTMDTEEAGNRAKGAGVTDRNVLTWFNKNVRDYDMLSQYLGDLKRITADDLSKVDIQMINELFS